MRRDDVRFAAAARDDGIHKISKFTWRAGAAGVVCSALIAVAFGHHAPTAQPSSSNHNGTTPSGQPAGGSNGSGSHQGNGAIVVPAQPPAPSQGGGQVTSGAS